jgi:hypothetical protein
MNGVFYRKCIGDSCNLSTTGYKNMELCYTLILSCQSIMGKWVNVYHRVLGNTLLRGGGQL